MTMTTEQEKMMKALGLLMAAGAATPLITLNATQKAYILAHLGITIT
jgi:hypothetical protein